MSVNKSKKSIAIKPIAITMGDPSGVGPEIIIKSLLTEALNAKPVVVIGCVRTFKKLLDQKIVPAHYLNVITDVDAADFRKDWINIIDEPLTDPENLEIGVVSAQSGNVAFRCIKKATELAMKGKVYAIATAPLNKEALHLAGHNYPGHTELFAKLTKTKEYAMVLYSNSLKVIHVSTHVSLKNFLANLSIERIETVVTLADTFLKRVGIPKPRIAVAGVNPHAGEHGLFGDEEIKFVNPAVELVRLKGIDAVGAIPPDTVFLKAHEGKYDMVVAMYHDQGHIPLKLLGFYDGVNITAGLPFIRTSADHGTAFDIAWQGIANPESMNQAIDLALRLV